MGDLLNRVLEVQGDGLSSPNAPLSRLPPPRPRTGCSPCRAFRPGSDATVTGLGLDPGAPGDRPPQPPQDRPNLLTSPIRAGATLSAYHRGSTDAECRDPSRGDAPHPAGAGLARRELPLRPLERGHHRPDPGPSAGATGSPGRPGH
jgi:hypothetical protein